MSKSKITLIVTIFTFFLLAVPFLVPTVIHFNNLNEMNKYILFSIRIPTVLTAFFTGGILAGGGLTFQSLFRNPLATPYTLGISSGAALGAVISIVVLNKMISFQGLTQVSAFLGATLSVLIVIAFIFQTKNISSNSVLLAGVAINFLFASLIMFFQYIGKEYDIFKITRWLLGSVGNVSLKSAVFIGIVFALLLVILILLADILDLMALGDQLAITKGVDLKKNKVILIVSVSFAVAIAISLTGPIGFVGIIVPHISRILTKSTHKTLVPFSMFFGGVLLVICDSIGRIILYPSVMPTGVITAMIGAPFFLLLLRKER